MHVIFVEPKFPYNQRQFVRGLVEAGATVSAVGERQLDDEMKGWLTFYEQVPSVVHEASMLEAVRSIQSRAWVDRLESTVEAHILPVARVREACGIPGTTYRTAFLCRDKPAMKEALRAAGVPCAQSRGVESAHELRAFVAEVDYPIILKPRSAAGASGTKRVDNDRELESAIAEYGLDRGASVAAEEFIEGHEGFYDTISIDGRVACDFASHYYPGVLDAMRTRWVSPQIVTTNRVSAAGYDEVKKMGQTVIDVLGIGTSATHMEWFFGPKGLKFSEIGCRPPGVGMWDVYAAANEFDIYREWGMAIVHGRIAQPPSRRFACGMINLRPNRDGRIVAYEGFDTIERSFGEWIVDYQFQPIGSATQPIEGGYMANSWLRMKHPDYDQLRRMLDQVGRTVKVLAG